MLDDVGIGGLEVAGVVLLIVPTIRTRIFSSGSERVHPLPVVGDISSKSC